MTQNYSKSSSFPVFSESTCYLLEIGGIGWLAKSISILQDTTIFDKPEAGIYLLLGAAIYLMGRKNSSDLLKKENLESKID